MKHLQKKWKEICLCDTGLACRVWLGFCDFADVFATPAIPCIVPDKGLLYTSLRVNLNLFDTIWMASHESKVTHLLVDEASC